MKIHPLDSLNTFEISATSKLINKAHPPPPPSTSWMFTSITVQEPPKDLVLKYLQRENETRLENGRKPSEPEIVIPRKSFAVLIDRTTGHVYEVIVNLSTEAVESFKRVKDGCNPTYTMEELMACKKMLRANPEIQKRCKEYGYEMDSVAIDTWTFGYSGDEPECKTKRILQFFIFGRECENDNMYAHPFDFVPVVDVVTGKLLRIDTLPIDSGYGKERNKPVEIPKKLVNYDADVLGKEYFRKDVKPLQVVQPDGPSFTVTGNEIQWQKFKFRISFNYREGLVLHNITFQDGDQLRPLIYRAAICELVVPYGDPRPPHHRKCAFDGGEAGFGNCANSLELGCDCLGSIKYFDAVLSTNAGEPLVIKNAVCLHEEDAGLLFKHTDFRNDKCRVARSRRLVVSFIATLINYEYAFYWNFYQDGQIEFESKSTGQLNTVLMAPGATTGGYGTIVSPGVNAQNHQHLFCARIDTMFDGLQNSVAMVDVKGLDDEVGSEKNPYGQGFVAVSKPLTTTLEAATDVCPRLNRSWRIYNKSSIHEITKQPVGWHLVPKSGQQLKAKPNSFVAQRASFTLHNFWVTPYKAFQYYPAGFYCNNHLGGDGLAEWCQSNENIDNKDIVIWHVFGLTHIPRVEDFPIMCVEPCGFVLKPVNFFKTNGALDVPSTSKQENKSTLVNGTNGHGCNGCE